MDAVQEVAGRHITFLTQRDVSGLQAARSEHALADHNQVASWKRCESSELSLSFKGHIESLNLSELLSSFSLILDKL